MESLENGLQPQSGATSVFLMRTELLASLQSWRSIDTDICCKRGLSQKYSSTFIFQKLFRPFSPNSRF